GDEALGQALGATQRRRDDRGAPEWTAVGAQQSAVCPDVVQGAFGDRAQSGRMPVAVLWVDEVPKEAVHQPMLRVAQHLVERRVAVRYPPAPVEPDDAERRLLDQDLSRGGGALPGLQRPCQLAELVGAIGVRDPRVPGAR